MNKIKVVEEVVDSKITKKLSFSYHFAQEIFEISTLEIHVFQSTDLELDFTSSNQKWKVDVVLEPSTTLELFLYQQVTNSKIQYRFQIPEDSKVEAYKFQSLAAGKEMVEAHLLGENATFHYYLKDLSKEKETFDYYIYHDHEKTNSNVKNNIVTYGEGKVTVQVSTFIPKGKKNCVANQQNRILNFNEKKSEIRPNLYIDEYEVEANHSAYIGRFSEEEMFYLKSRGLSSEVASRLLLNGFLVSDIPTKKMKRKIELTTKKEWR